METTRKAIHAILSVLIIALYVLALVPCALGRIILIIPSVLAYFVDNDYVPEWAQSLADKLGDLYEEQIRL